MTHFSRTQPVIKSFGGLDNFTRSHRAAEARLRSERNPVRFLENYLEDSEVLDTLKHKYGPDVLTQLREANRPQRDSMLREMKELGYSQKRLARITGIGRSIIQRA